MRVREITAQGFSTVHFVAVISKSRMLTHSRTRKGFRGCSAGIADY